MIQSFLHWEDPEQNLEVLGQKAATFDQGIDLLLLPEMFTTGFTLHPERVAEPMEGRSMRWMNDLAGRMQAVVAGSLIIREEEKYYNRLVWMPPSGNYACYDKGHLFSFAGENKRYTAGRERLFVRLKGWKLMPLICYDLRFPVWSRNAHREGQGFDYDALIYVANWPAVRSHVWRVLLMARALENMCYVVGLNRVGTDDNGIDHQGDSAVIDPRGESILGFMPDQEACGTAVLDYGELSGLREKFRAWADWDAFRLG